jgi:hypothetical protein
MVSFFTTSRNTLHKALKKRKEFRAEFSYALSTMGTESASSVSDVDNFT